MGKIYEDIEIEGKKVKVKVDTGSDFALSLRKEVIKKLKLIPHPTARAILFTEEGKKEYSVWIARIKIKGCEFGAPQNIVEAIGKDNLLGHPILQALGAKVDEDKEEFTFNPMMCPRGDTGGMTGEIIA